MTIRVEASAQHVRAPAMLTFTNHSGAQVELTLLLLGLPPVHHAFDMAASRIRLDMPALRAGTTYPCTAIVEVYAPDDNTLGGSYDLRVDANGMPLVLAKGCLPPGAMDDMGVADFLLIVA